MFAEEGETFFSGVAFSCTPITSSNYTQWVEKNKYINLKKCGGQKYEIKREIEIVLGFFRRIKLIEEYILQKRLTRLVCMIHGMQSSYVCLGTGEDESLIADQSTRVDPTCH